MKTLLKLAVITIIACTALFISCSDSSDDPVEQTFTIGQSYGGGIIFYLDDTGKHGLIAATEDIDGDSGNPGLDGKLWSTVTDQTPAVAAGTAIGTGKANTDEILIQNSSADCAAKLCVDYNGGGFSDWFLPSRDELHEIYLQRTIVGNLQEGMYWSSSEIDQTGAYAKNFDTGNNSIYNKGNEFLVRPIRAF